jgi:transcription elongation factor GreA
MDKQYLSKERLEELKKELENLKTEKRREVAERLHVAKDFGDLSENSEYTEARDEQAKVEQRIFELEEFLKDTVIIKKSAATGTVGVGSRVTVKKGKDTLVYEIVGSSEAKPEEKKISNESPLGSAFLEHKVGDVVSVHIPSGTMEYEIVKVE